MGLRLYTWWRSQASFRVRIALRLKGLHAEMSYVDLAKREQHDPAFALNPAQALPVLIDGDGPPLLQSLAILEYRPCCPAARASARMCAPRRRCSLPMRIRPSFRACGATSRPGSGSAKPSV